MSVELEAQTLFLQQQADKLKAQAEQQALMAQILRVGLEALGTRLLVLLSLLLDAGMFGWAMAAGTWPSIAAAVLFAVATWCLVKLTPHRGESHAS
jgi:hypothetical protein